MGIHSHKMVLASAKAHADKCVNALATVKNPAAIPKLLDAIETCRWMHVSDTNKIEAAYRAVMEDKPDE